MKIQLRLFGVYRDFDASGQIDLDLEAGGCIADLRRALLVYAEANWPGYPKGLAAKSAFASETGLLRDADALPADGLMAVLPPVSGG